MRFRKEWVFGDPVLMLNKGELATLRRAAAIAEKAVAMIEPADIGLCDFRKLEMYATGCANSTDPKCNG